MESTSWSNVTDPRHDDRGKKMTYMPGTRIGTMMALATSTTTSTTRTIGLSSGTKLDTKMKFLLNKEMDPLQRPTPTTRTSTKERAKPDPVLWDLDAQPAAPSGTIPTAAL